MFLLRKEGGKNCVEKVRFISTTFVLRKKVQCTPKKERIKKKISSTSPLYVKSALKNHPRRSYITLTIRSFLLHVQVQKYRVAHFQRLNVLPSPRNILLAGRLRYRHFKLFPSVHITPFSVVPFIFQPPQDYSRSLQMSYTITSIMNGEFESSKALVNGHVIRILR